MDRTIFSPALPPQVATSATRGASTPSGGTASTRRWLVGSRHGQGRGQRDPRLFSRLGLGAEPSASRSVGPAKPRQPSRKADLPPSFSPPSFAPEDPFLDLSGTLRLGNRVR